MSNTERLHDKYIKENFSPVTAYKPETASGVGYVPNENDYRSFVYSALKCGFGWDGCIPDGCDYDDWENRISKGFKGRCEAEGVAQIIADDIHENGGSFRERIDGMPNRLLPTGLRQQAE